MKYSEIFESTLDIPKDWKVSMKRGISSKIYSKKYDIFFGTVTVNGLDNVIAELTHEGKTVWKKKLFINSEADLVKAMQLVDHVASIAKRKPVLDKNLDLSVR